MRLDKYLQSTLQISRNKAQMLIQEGSIKINGKHITKASFSVWENDKVEVEENEKLKYVSRSAIKLKRFLEKIYTPVNNSSLSASLRVLPFKKGENNTKQTICLDIWASTGGFTQILLEFSTDRVHALDVGTSQLSETLRTDERVTSIENTDIRKYNPAEPFYHAITCDVSFISLTKIIDDIIRLSHQETHIILLYKPQFEVGKKNLTKQNLPKNDKIITSFLNDFCQLLRDKNLQIFEVEKSALTGEAGNQEYFIWCQKK